MTTKDLIQKLWTPYIGKQNKLVIHIELWDEYKTFYKKEFDKNGKTANSYAKKLFLREYTKKINVNDYVKLQSDINEMYNDGYGLKLIAREFGISYSECRQLFGYLDIEIRTGRNVVTDRLKAFRKIKADAEAKNKTGWNSIESQAKIKNKNTQRGVQGYYFNNSYNKFVWLRSTYEFIYAKWLDNQKIKWDVEVTTYKLKNNVIYRPDFFIYDKDNTLAKIIEIKGFWRDKEYKAIELNNKMSIDVIVITNIDSYIVKDSNYGKELNKWKSQRILKIN